MTAKQVCALAFDEAGISFAEDGKNGNKSFYKNQVKSGGFDGNQKADEGIGDKPFDLEAHDKQHHHGHYDGGKCKYRDEAVQKGLITPEQAKQKTGSQQPESKESGEQKTPQMQEIPQKEPPQITAEQILEQFKNNPESLNNAKEGLKTEPKNNETPIGNIVTESPVQEAVVNELSEEAESGNPNAVKALNNLKDFNDLKEEIGAFERAENESTDDFVDRFNQLLARINPEQFNDEQRTALSNLANFIKKRVESENGVEIPQPNTVQQQLVSEQKYDTETGLPEYVGPDGKTYVDVSGLGFFKAWEAAYKVAKQGKEVLDEWTKMSDTWQNIIKEHNSNSIDDQNRRSSVNATAQITAEMMMSDYFDSFINMEGLSESDKLDAIGRKAAFDAASGNAEKQARIFSAFNKWSSEKRKSIQSGTESEGGVANQPLDEEGKRITQSFVKLPTLEELGVKEGDVKIDPRAEAYQKELDSLDHSRNEGVLDAKGYDDAVQQLKEKYIEQGYDPDPHREGVSGWSHRIPVNSIFHDISNDQARSVLTQDLGEDLSSTLKELGMDAEVEGEPQIDSNETTYFVKLNGNTQPAHIKKVLEAVKNNMGDSGIRLDTVVNGKPGYVAMHIPNRMQDVIGFNKFFEDPETRKALESGLVPIPIGKGPNGKMMLVDIASSPTPHALIGGATKSGKSVQGHNIIAALLLKDSRLCSPVIIDPKGQEFSAYKGIKGVGYSDRPQSAIKALLKQQDERRKLLAATGCRNIQEYNAKYPDHPIPYMPVVFDEMTQAFQNAGGPDSELARDVGTLARLARDTGISLIGLTQNADAKSIPTELKNQLGFRMAFRTQTEAASRDLLGLTASQNGNAAKGLKGAGDGYIKNPDDSLSRFQAAFIPTGDIEALVKWRKARDDGKLESTKRTAQDIANEAREEQWKKEQQIQQQTAVSPTGEKNYIVDVGQSGGDPNSALQMTASSIISDAKNLTKAEALGRLTQAYQHYIGSIGDDDGKQKLAATFNSLKNEMNANSGGAQYKADGGVSSSQSKTSSGNGSVVQGRDPPVIQPEDIVSPEEAQQIAQRQADKQKFDATHKKFHPDTQQGEEDLENQTYEEEANQIYQAHESGKLTGEKFRKRLAELDAGHKERLGEIRDKYSSQKQNANSRQTSSQPEQIEKQEQKSNSSNLSDSRANTTSASQQQEEDPLEMFLNPTSEQSQKFATQEYKEDSDKIMEDYRNHKITREEATERAQKARDKRDKTLGAAKKEAQESNSQSEEESKLRSTVKTDSHGKPIAHAVPGKGRGKKGNGTPLSHQDFNSITKSLPPDFVLEGGDNATRDGNGNVWAHHKGGQGNGSRGWFDKDNKWHWAVNTTHPKYKGENSPEAQAAKAKWLGTNLNEAQNGKAYRNIAFGTDEQVPGYALDAVDYAILSYFRSEN